MCVRAFFFQQIMNGVESPDSFAGHTAFASTLHAAGITCALPVPNCTDGVRSFSFPHHLRSEPPHLFGATAFVQSHRLRSEPPALTGFVQPAFFFFTLLLFILVSASLLLLLLLLLIVFVFFFGFFFFLLLCS